MHPERYEDGAWHLDTGATNHMTSCRAALSSIDESIHGTVRFGDGSKVDICGRGAIIIEGRDKQHKVLTEVYYIPSLKCNIISLGQLKKMGAELR